MAPVVGAVVWLGVAAAAVSGTFSFTLVDVLLLLAPLVIVPLGLPLAGVTVESAAYANVAGGVLLSMALAATTDLAGLPLLAAGWLSVSLGSLPAPAGRLVERVRRWRQGPPSWPAVGRDLALVYLVVAAAFAVASVADFDPLDLGADIVQLTAVHYAFAGFGASLLASHAAARHPGRTATAAVVLVGGAPPVVAAGFATRWAVFQVGGALLLLAGTYATAWCAWRAAARERFVAEVLLRVSAVAVVVPMVLAVSWAAGNFWPVPALSIPDMARTHGVVNAFGFCLCGLLGWRSATPVVTPDAWRPTPAP